MMKHLLCLTLLLGCTTKFSSPEKSQDFRPRREEFLGYWIGEMPTKDGKFMRWLVEQRKDGAFTLTHVIKNSPEDPVKFNPEKATFELGTWGVSGDVYFTATRQYFEKGKVANFDTTDSGLYDAYKIVFFDGKTFTYRSLETGEEFTLKKIPKDAPLQL
jgi:hypothetical protein